MKNSKLISIIAVVVALALLAVGGLVVGFDRAADIGGAYLISADFIEDFNRNDIESIMKEAGATGVIIQAQQTAVINGYRDVESVEVLFEVEGDADNTRVDAVYNKAKSLLEAKYTVISCELTSLSSTFNKQTAIKMWPALIVLAILLAYVFIRFGVKNAFGVILTAFVPTATTAGIVALTGLKVTGFTIPALLMIGALALAIAIFNMLIAKVNKGRMDDSSEYALALTKKLTMVASAIAVIAFAVLFIIGSAILQNFALTALIGVALVAVTTIFVMPGAAK